MSEWSAEPDRLGGWRGVVLRFLRVPHEPEDPIGEERSLLVFRAAPPFFHYKLALWAVGQIFSLIGFIAVLGLELSGVFSPLEWLVDRRWALAILVATVLLYLFQTVLSLAIIRLDYELRWYKVTDAALRIREGVWKVREMTMTFANIQNLSISQGPLQRLLGIADLEVQSAGGGSKQGPKKEHSGGLDMHTATFRGVANAEELRDLMRRRLVAAKGAGLGDPDDRPEPAATTPSLAPTTLTPAARRAVADLLSEAEGLRHTVERRLAS